MSDEELREARRLFRHVADDRERVGLRLVAEVLRLQRRDRENAAGENVLRERVRALEHKIRAAQVS